MHDIPELVDGYRRFLATRYREEAAAYRALAASGQRPKVMVVACCDSRVDPAAIFSAGPGQLFVVRNVANLVPPFEPHGDYHGTSAALQFAVEGLGVETVLVMGHARCGGIAAFRQGLHDWSGSRSFIDRWMSLLNPARAAALHAVADRPEIDPQQVLEYAAVRQSLANLRTFPFVEERIAAGTLRLRGAYFDVADGNLLALAPDGSRFVPVL